jgi:Xaa-Pro aminopeptidase
MRFCLTLAVTLGVWTISTPAQVHHITASEYQSRRAALAKAIGPDGVFIAFSYEPARRTGDVDWPFRQEDNLLYLTGMNVPETTLVMLPGERDRQEIIFASDRDPLNERWTGKIASKEEVSAATGVREVVSLRRFNGFIDALFQGSSFAEGRGGYFAPPAMPSFLASIRAGRAQVWLLLGDRSRPGRPTREQQFAEELRRRYPEVRFHDASSVLLTMREIKSEAELALIQRAVDVTVEAQKAAMARVKTANFENQVEATVAFTFRNLGACCWAFPSIVAAGRNATTLHYEANNDPIVRGGLLLTDLGAEVEGYSADVTRTYPADGTFSPEQRAIYDAVLAAQTETIEMMRPGRKFIDVNTAAVGTIGRELVKLGLVTKNTPEQVALYFFHGVGHPLGLQTHDVFDRMRTFEPGMVVTNEPGVYVRKGDILASDVFAKLTAPEQASVRSALDRYDGIGVRIEDDVLITSGQPRIMSVGAPRSPKEIEALMAR